MADASYASNLASSMAKQHTRLLHQVSVPPPSPPLGLCHLASCLLHQVSPPPPPPSPLTLASRLVCLHCASASVECCCVVSRGSAGGGAGRQGPQVPLRPPRPRQQIAPPATPTTSPSNCTLSSIFKGYTAGCAVACAVAVVLRVLLQGGSRWVCGWMLWLFLLSSVAKAKVCEHQPHLLIPPLDQARVVYSTLYSTRVKRKEQRGLIFYWM
jgi:hypothetical protein